ncbi:MAG: RNA polymerase sigma factor [Myxococcales bacterium]|nr:RNA polymerase sigma factor [Myxococcales bacterium]
MATGDRRAFDELVACTRDGVWRLLRSLTADEVVAEDALQETYVAVWRSAGSYGGAGSGRAWVFGVARRHAARTWRRRAGEPSRPTPLHELGAQAGWGQDPEQLTSALEDRARLRRSLGALSTGDREIIVLCDLEGLSGPEVGSLMGITANAARVRLHRARLRLMAKLRGEADGEGS